MLSVSHAVTGSFIAVAVPNPLISVPLILASHYLEDAVPHWDVGTGLTSGRKSARTAFLLELPDLLLAGLLILLFFPLPHLFSTPIPSLLQAPQIWGGFVGLLPDFLEAPRNFLKYEPKLLKPFNSFHQRFHHSIPRMAAGLAPQLLLLALLWYLK